MFILLFLLPAFALAEEPHILISKNDLTLTLIGPNGETVRQYGIACSKFYGNKEKRGDNKTPEGVFHISQILNSVDLTHDFGDGKGPVKGAYGPWFLRLGDTGYIDIGMHGTHLPESIGSRCTEGCIRMTNEDVVELKSMVKLGMKVIILPDE